MTKGEDVLIAVERFATAAHEGQMRKYTPEPYMVHPVRVMKLCREYTDRIPVLAAALLHDVLEDTPVSREEMLAFLRTVMDEAEATETLALVVDLTDVYIKADYPQHNRKRRKQLERERIAATSPDSQTVKYADIIDNCNEIVRYDKDFARVFLNECRILLKEIPRGNQELYRLATETVEANLNKLKQLK